VKRSNQIQTCFWQIVPQHAQCQFFSPTNHFAHYLYSNFDFSYNFNLKNPNSYSPNLKFLFIVQLLLTNIQKYSVNCKSVNVTNEMACL